MAGGAPSGTITFGFGAGAVTIGALGAAAAALAPRRTPAARRPEFGRRDGSVPVGEVFAHGSGECDQLGLGDAQRERRKPTLVSGPGSTIASLSCGAMHAACLASDGALWTWGCNDDGALGRPAGETECEPRRLELPGRSPVRMVTCGDCHTCALDAWGCLWQWGTYKDATGYIGIARPGGVVVEKSHEPAVVETRLLGTISKVASGENHTVVAVSGGGAFAWGSNATGQLGLADGRGCQVEEAEVGGEKAILEARPGGGVVARYSALAEPLPVVRYRTAETEEGVAGLGLERLRALAAGNVTFIVDLPDRTVPLEEKRALLVPQAMCLTGADGAGVGSVFASCHGTFLTLRNGRVLGCGLNGDGQIGVGYASSGVLTPRTIRGTTGASWLGGGSQSSAALVNGSVFTWGKAEECGLGLGASSPPVLRPREVVGLPAIRALRCGSHHMLACSEAGDVFTWGCGLTHQLGNRPRDFTDPTDKDDEPSDEPRPYLLSSKQLEGRFVLLADGGAQHSLELAWNGEYARLPTFELVPVPKEAPAPPCEAICIYKRPAAEAAAGGPPLKRPAAAAHLAAAEEGAGQKGKGAEVQRKPAAVEPVEGPRRRGRPPKSADDSAVLRKPAAAPEAPPSPRPRWRADVVQEGEGAGSGAPAGAPEPVLKRPAGRTRIVHKRPAAAGE